MLEIIVPYINTQIDSLNMFDTRYGLCDFIAKDGKTFPAEYCNGEYKPVTDFDLHKGLVYHRLIGDISKEEVEEENSNGCNPFYETTFPLRTVACIKKEHIKGIGNDAYLENKIAQNISNVIAGNNNKALRILLRCDGVEFIIEGIKTNRDEIFDEEYSGYDQSFMRYEFLYIAIDYSVKATGNVSCFENYDC
jgi:hypothetical protein